MSPLSHCSPTKLSFFDFVSLVVGAIIGADIYVVAGIGAPLIGPALLVVWIVAGLVAILIALCFAQCAAIEPESGGPYAYVRSAFGRGPALVVGWALYLALWSALAVFPVAASRYLADALALGPAEVVAFKVAFVALFTLSNLLGVREAGIVDDVLTGAKLVPLAILIVVVGAFAIQHSEVVRANLIPIAPLGWGEFGSAFVLVFWAYAGFEVSSLPANAVEDPQSTMPRGIILGMLIAVGFYFFTNLAVFAVVPWSEIGQSNAPLALAMAQALEGLGVRGSLGFGLMTAGAIVSISGVSQATTLGAAELAGTLGENGIFPRILAHRSARFGTRDCALLAQGVTTLLASLLFGLTHLIEIAVVFLILVYALTAISARALLHRQPERKLHVPGVRIIPILATAAAVTVVLGIPLTDLALGAGLLCTVLLITLVDRLFRQRR